MMRLNVLSVLIFQLIDIITKSRDHNIVDISLLDWSVLSILKIKKNIFGTDEH